ncbi:outer membrane beta-barrel protein [Parvularcula dongshanensis]|uniref:Opacity protein-like surface antigen n=1 Tax=Parvularcula dongshanensis TaxID=1173995 RepID=A0A840I570_9PROT|nr:outer membrane beta-barrel protein [Parvularcula dongshanensis]MBB4659431.1 opacity protein-like surface antigen [Parvularcula dongshanensis]
MKTCLLALSAALLLTPSGVRAQDAVPSNAYLQVHIGASLVTEEEVRFEGAGAKGVPGVVLREVDYDTGVAFGGAFGYQLSPMFAAEAELTARVNDFDGNLGDDALTVTSLMANGVLTAPLKSSVRPYLGAGVGFAYSNLDGSNLALAWGAKAGLLYLYAPGRMVGFEASYIGTDGFGTESIDAADRIVDVHAEYGGAALLVSWRTNLGF